MNDQADPKRGSTPNDRGCNRCRLFEEGQAHSLCDCGSTMVETEALQQMLCYAAIVDVCEGPGLGRNKNDAVTRLNSRMKVGHFKKKPYVSARVMNYICLPPMTLPDRFLLAH